MQKLVGTELYVFDLTPFEITQQTADATVVYVQLECIDGYKELNPSLADIMQPFNQWLNCVKAPWEDGVEPTPVTGHTLTINGSDIHSHVTLYLDDVQQASVTDITNVAEGTAIKYVPTENVENYTLVSGAEWDSEENAWVATMPDADLEIVINYSEPATGHTLTINGTDIQSYINVLFNDVQQEVSSSYSDVEADTAIMIVPTENVENYTLVSGAEWSSALEAWVATMPDDNLTIEINYAAPAADPLVTLDGNWEYDTWYVNADGMDDWFHVISQRQGQSEPYMANIPSGGIVFLGPDPSEFVSVTINGEPAETVETGWGTRYGFTVGNSDMTVTYSYTKKPRYNTTFTADSTPNAPDVVQIEPNSCHENDTVYIRFLHGNSSSNITVTSTDVSLNYDQNMDEYYFTMPAQDVEIKAVASSINVDVDLTNTDLTFDSESAYDPQETYYPGALFKVNCASGKIVSDYMFSKSENDTVVTPDNPQDPEFFGWDQFVVHFYGPNADTVTFSDYTPL